MANGYVQLPDDSGNAGKKEDHFVTAGNQYREAVCVADPSTVAAAAAVSSANGLQVDVTRVTGNVASTVADAANVVEGVTTDAKVVGDNSGTLSAKLRGLLYYLGLVVDISNTRLNVFLQNATLPLPTGASTAAKQPALGTAGSASADVISIQGIASGTAVPVSGSLTVNPPASATATLSNVAESLSSVTVLASNASRLGFIVINDSDSACFIKYGATASATSYVRRLLSRERMTTGDDGINYTGIITGIWDTTPGTSGHASARVTELTA